MNMENLDRSAEHLKNFLCVSRIAIAGLLLLALSGCISSKGKLYRTATEPVVGNRVLAYNAENNMYVKLVRDIDSFKAYIPDQEPFEISFHADKRLPDDTYVIQATARNSLREDYWDYSLIRYNNAWLARDTVTWFNTSRDAITAISRQPGKAAFERYLDSKFKYEDKATVVDTMLDVLDLQDKDIASLGVASLTKPSDLAIDFEIYDLTDKDDLEEAARLVGESFVRD